MKIRSKIAAALTTVGLVGLIAAQPANAAGGVTPVCYYKKVVTSSSYLLTLTVYNVVAAEQVLQYPARTKQCHVVQTQFIDRRFAPDVHKVIDDRWITVKF